MATNQASRCVNLVLKTLAEADGDCVIIRTGRVPTLFSHGKKFPIAREVVQPTAVRQIAKVLLPQDHLTALADIGETKFELPHVKALPREEFSVKVSESHDDLEVEIDRHHIPSEDAVPGELLG